MCLKDPRKEATGISSFDSIFVKKKNSKNPRLLWKWVGGSRSHSDFFGGKSSQNSPKPVLIFWSSIPCVFCLYNTLLKVVGYYDLSVTGLDFASTQSQMRLKL